ncbi:MAG: hypothetical protein HC882_02200 [Acidobacteria bacterium]|nr:hypothetical protein [Acidobacteriota bacterium]
MAVLTKYEEHTQTVRYRPLGDSAAWEIGEPYVPFEALDSPPPWPYQDFRVLGIGQ